MAQPLNCWIKSKRPSYSGGRGVISRSFSKMDMHLAVSALDFGQYRDVHFILLFTQK